MYCLLDMSLSIYHCHISFLDTGAIPTRKANLTLSIGMTFQLAFNDLNSPAALEFINALELQVDNSLLHDLIIITQSDPILDNFLIY